MNRYAKMRFVKTNKAKSIDFSDLFSPPQTPKPITSQTQQTTKQASDNGTTHTTHDTLSRMENEDGGGKKRSHMILSKNFSTTSQRFKADNKQTSTLQATVKRAFSMRRSTSVSERYCRIHDQSDHPALGSSSPTHDDDDEDDVNHETMEIKKKKNKKGARSLKSVGVYSEYN
ncbi:hypothetical protein IFM89_025485 [Coptis chinensis]|uniref:Uncharacterized protein n=1 Tax=Coptis chinensis TaxID=261450 RepID=A0A835LP36_9MAGN|nr:hypothetical protein IFM89_025485 [Coptis chinensis]